MNEHTVFQKVFLVIILIISGCAAMQERESYQPQTLSENIAQDTAARMNWLMIAGAVTIAFGVAAFMQGQKASTSIITAGIVLTAAAILITSFTTFITEYRQWAVGLLILLGIIGFFVLTGQSLDRNRDGKINWKDIVFVFTKFRITKKKP